MRVYLVEVMDKDDPTNKWADYIAEGKAYELDDYDRYLPKGYSDEDIHYYFGEGEHDFSDGGEIETEEFKYLVKERVA